jgi:hypothetical protein
MQNASIQRTLCMTPEARYAYYRRCQEFRRSGEQCKAPAEKGAQICHAHAGQRAMAERRARERQAVLEEAVAQMRKQGRPEFEMIHLFMDFRGIQVTIAVVAQALIDGRIDCKTAGRLAWDLQRMSKLLWLYHKAKKATKNCHSSPLSQPWGRSGQATEREGQSRIAEELPERVVPLPKLQEITMGTNWAANEHEETRIPETKVLRFPHRYGSSNGPPAWAKAA